MVSSLFFCALRAPGRHSRPGLPTACVVTPTGDRRSAIPLVFSAEKTATSKRTPYHSGSLRSAAPRACEARRKRNRRKMGQARLHPFSPVLFRYRLPRQNSSHLPTQTQVLWYFLDARKYRLPLVLLHLLTAFPPCSSASASPRQTRANYPADNPRTPYNSRYARCTDQSHFRAYRQPASDGGQA